MNFSAHENTSPLSSPDVQSTKDTLTTPLTCHSKDDFELVKDKVCAIKAIKPPNFPIQACNCSIDAYTGYDGHRNVDSPDPFVPSARMAGIIGNQGRKLSATADSFYPLSLTTKIGSFDLAIQTGTPAETPGQFSSIKSSSQIDCASDSQCDQNDLTRQITTNPLQNAGSQTFGKTPAILTHATVTQIPNLLSTTASSYNSAVYTPHDAQETRYLIIANLPECFRVYLDAVLATPIVSQSRLAVVDHAASHGLVLLRYDDVRCAVSSLAKIRSEFPSWNCGFSSSCIWRSLVTNAIGPFPSDYEGQIIVTLSRQGRMLEVERSEANCNQYYPSLVKLMNAAGAVRSTRCLVSTAWVLMLHVEFCSLKAADSVEKRGLRRSFPEFEVMVTKYDGRVNTEQVQTSSYHAWPIKEPASHEMSLFVPRISVSRKCIATSSKLQPLTTTATANRLRTRAIEGVRHLDDAVSNHNAVDINRVRNGQDVRTTIMLRNIPNKVDQPTLKTIVDESSLGKYDFMYLRIDFANNCNVGYAFINFEDVSWVLSHSIIDFVESVAGRKWNCFNSDKVAEVSYATIQGRDCLIQKFRNSSVMLESPLFRPKIYYTGAGSLAGQEEEFPSPDNHSKMRRSLENAEHVGLFAPRLGYRSREEQRRGPSRYERGNRLAERHIQSES